MFKIITRLCMVLYFPVVLSITVISLIPIGIFGTNSKIGLFCFGIDGVFVLLIFPISILFVIAHFDRFKEEIKNIAGIE